MLDQMSPGGHAATTVVASAAIAFLSGSLPLATAVALGGFFIDVDHGGGQKGIMLDDLLTAVREEFKENEDLPNTTNPEDWAKIAGKKGERIVSAERLRHEAPAPTRRVERIPATGQHL